MGAGEDDPSTVGDRLVEVLVALYLDALAHGVQAPALHAQELHYVAAEVAERAVRHVLHQRVVHGTAEYAGVVAPGCRPLTAPESVEDIGDGDGEPVAEGEGDKLGQTAVERVDPGAFPFAVRSGVSHLSLGPYRKGRTPPSGAPYRPAGA